MATTAQTHVGMIVTMIGTAMSRRIRPSGSPTAADHASRLCRSSRGPPIQSLIGRISGAVRAIVIATATPVSTIATARIDR